MRVIFCLTDLRCGGAEKSIAILSRSLAQRGHEVFIAIHADAKEPPFFPIDPAVQIISLGRVCTINASWLRKIWDGLRSIFKLRHTFKHIKPDRIIAFTETINIRAIIAAAALDIPVIISERNDPRTYGIGPVISALRWLLYPFAARLVLITDSARDFYPKRLQKRIVSIANSIPTVPSLPKTENNSELLIVSVGRLISLKRMDMTIRAFARLRHPNARLIIVGEGPERPRLEALIKELQIEQCVELAGLVADPSTILARADIFMFTSRSEGIGNVILEAMAWGLPVLVTEYGAALHTLITHNEDGLIVQRDDEEASAANLEQLMQDPKLRARLGSNARLVVKRYSVENITNQWEKLINSV